MASWAMALALSPNSTCLASDSVDHAIKLYMFLAKIRSLIRLQQPIHGLSQNPTHSEIGDLDLVPRVDQKIRAFDIALDDLPAVERRLNSCSASEATLVSFPSAAKVTSSAIFPYKLLNEKNTVNNLSSAAAGTWVVSRRGRGAVGWADVRRSGPGAAQRRRAERAGALFRGVGLGRWAGAMSGNGPAEEEEVGTDTDRAGAVGWQEDGPGSKN
ncbi:hypothetical protein ACFX2I_008333 [Malus domestica]